MSYVVLARKLRPTQFHDLVGQEIIWKTLINAIEADRVAHAFLFTGARGVGKTSCARILTKALNCLAPINHEPCNECINCQEISENISPDVMEIDAASNRGIEHIRELRNHVKFAPAKCKFKTYIIDEVHMLTVESFNALLKTLEEPPEHVKFILATTDPHKIPQTVISRCQRFDFVRIPVKKMVKYLTSVAESEGIQVSSIALGMIAKSATGGMRDALTSLDMVVSYSGTTIQDEDVIQILGLNNSIEVDRLLEGIIQKNLKETITILHRLVDKGHSLSTVIIGLLSAVKDLTLVKSIPDSSYHWRDLLPEQLQLYQKLAEQTSMSALQQYFHVLLEIETQMKKSSQALICVEMGIVKLCSVDSLVGVAEVIEQIRSVAKKKKGSQGILEKLRDTKPIIQPIKVQKTQKLEDTINSQKTESFVKTEKVQVFTTPAKIKDTSFEIPAYIDEQPPVDYSYQNTPKLEKIVEVAKTKNPNLLEKKTNFKSVEKSPRSWEGFVQQLNVVLPKSAIAILRNTRMQILNDTTLVLSDGYFEGLIEEHKQIINQKVQEFFFPVTHVEYTSSIFSTDETLTIKEKEDLIYRKKIQKIKDEATKDQNILIFQKFFPKSQIVNVVLKG
ncbi:MAG: DNA polymerase III subunit gamma/tau [bacterium]|jgi:DNA polymerase III subunit gamma/tau